MEFSVNKETILIDFLIDKLGSKSKTKIKNIIKSGRIAINNKAVKNPNIVIKIGQNIKMIDKANIKNKQNRFNVLYEDKFIIVAEKPAGLLSISTDSENKSTFYRFISDYVKEATNGKERIFIVHRLDRDVSGVMIFAKSPEVKQFLQDNWEMTNKVYITIVEGIPAQKEGKIESWLKENKSHFVYVSTESEDAYFSITKYKLISTRKDYSLLEIDLETGRKNQIRVQLAQIGHPVAGDIKYGAKTNPVSRICLHSHTLSIIHPITKKPLIFTSNIPPKMLKLIKK